MFTKNYYTGKVSYLPVWTPAFVILASSVEATFISGFLAQYAYRHDDAPGNLSFAYLQVSVTAWAFLMVIIYAAPVEGSVVRAVYHVRTLFSLLSGILAIVFIARYTRSPVLMSRYYRGTLWGLYVVYASLWLANPANLAYTELTVQTYGPLTVVSPTLGVGLVAVIIIYYVLLTAAFVSLFRFGLDPSNIYRKQTLLIGGAFLLVTVGTIGTLLTDPGRQGVDLAILLQSLGGAIIALAIYRFDFLSVVSPAKQAAVDQIDDPVVVLDNEDRIAYTNQAAEAIDLGESALGKRLDQVASGLEAAVQSGDTYQFGEDANLSMDGGTAKVFEPTENCLTDQYGTTSGRILLLRDITAQKRREQVLEQFASSLSHDLRNPLTVAHGKAKLARETGEVSHLDQSLNAMERIDELVEQLLDLSQSGEAGLDIQPVRLSTAAEDAWETVDTAAATLNHAGPDRSLFASYGHLQQILENLFRNAVEHNDQPVTIRVERTDTGFVVADDGTGIPADKRERVFERGYTCSNTGNGLGLDIVSQLTDLHGWTVSLTESADGGAKFVFEI